MDNVQKIKIVSILCPVHLPPSRAYSVVYEPSYEKVVPVPTLGKIFFICNLPVIYWVRRKECLTKIDPYIKTDWMRCSARQIIAWLPRFNFLLASLPCYYLLNLMTQYDTKNVWLPIYCYLLCIIWYCTIHHIVRFLTGRHTLPYCSPYIT